MKVATIRPTKVLDYYDGVLVFDRRRMKTGQQLHRWDP